MTLYRAAIQACQAAIDETLLAAQAFESRIVTDVNAVAYSDFCHGLVAGYRVEISATEADMEAAKASTRDSQAKLEASRVLGRDAQAKMAFGFLFDLETRYMNLAL